jgi:hypothetical protein
MLVAVSTFTVFLAVDTIAAQAGGLGGAGNLANYNLAQDRFEFNNSTYNLTLQFRGAPIIDNSVEWHVVGTLPMGVASARIDRINGQTVFRFFGFAPHPEHVFNIIAVVTDGNRQIVIPLTVSIFL